MGHFFSTLNELLEDDTDRLTLPPGTQTLTRSYIREKILYTTHHLRISEGPTRLGPSVFARGSESIHCLKSIALPESLFDIGDNAFSHCDNLQALTLPPHLSSIGTSAFDGCAGIRSMTIPRGVTRIESKTFAFCMNLSNLTFSGHLTFIGDEAFLSCYMMSQLTIPDTVQEIGDRAFMLCGQLRTLTLPEQFCTQQERARLRIDPSVQCIPHASRKDTPEPASLRR